MRKAMLVMIAAAAFAAAANYELVVIEGSGYELEPAAGSQFQGLDYNADESLLAVALWNFTYGPEVWQWNPATGYGEEMLYLHSENQNPFGVVWSYDTDYTFYTNDIYDIDWFLSNDGETWYPTTGVGDCESRGMTYSGDGYIWTSYGTGQVCRMTDYPDNPEVFGVPQVPAQQSGITHLEHQGMEYLLVATYEAQYHGLYLYEYTGATPTFVDEIPCPVDDCSSFRGLAYAADRNTVFFAYKRNDGYWCFREAYLQAEQALAEDTWGSIKAGDSR
jgi:hypothetical protein